jgi:hypothetical protein
MFRLDVPGRSMRKPNPIRIAMVNTRAPGRQRRQGWPSPQQPAPTAVADLASTGMFGILGIRPLA